MLISSEQSHRDPTTRRLRADLVVVGGGFSGACAAIAAARQGIKVVLVQDRPVLGGNASSEVRLWILGATSHMGNNNRWSREGGIVDEILVENTFRNPEGNPFLVDALLLEKVTSEANITLLLNTAIFRIEKEAGELEPKQGRIKTAFGFCSQNSTLYELEAPLFCDASGDGIIAFLSGAAFRMGAESAGEFGEKFAPTKDYGELLGHSLYFYSKDLGHPVQFTPPAFALTDLGGIPRFRSINTKDFGCRLWWIEFGGRLDTVHQTEEIKWELWKIVYGVWNYIKNSGKFPEAANLTLEWVGSIPGKRESRRFEGDTWLIQQDIVEQRSHADAVAHGGWSIDLHPSDGVFSEKPGCNQWHSKGVYQIPYRCLYSKNVPNLFLAGRTISASHVAFGSSRVMGTCGAIGEAVGVAAALCNRHQTLPRRLGQERIAELQTELLRVGHHIPGLSLNDSSDLAGGARLEASSEFELSALPPDGPIVPLDASRAMMLPVGKGVRLAPTLYTHADAGTQLRVQLRQSSRTDNYTPDVVIEELLLAVEAGTDRPLRISFEHRFSDERYAFVCLMANPAVSVRMSLLRVTGVLSLCHEANRSVAVSATQSPPAEIGVDSFEFWTPRRRPGGHNLALCLEEPLRCFGVSNLVNGQSRPSNQPNAWVAALADAVPQLKLIWSEPQEIAAIELSFDTDFDHPMESVLYSHPERRMPFCVRRYRIVSLDDGSLLGEVTDNHQTRGRLQLSRPVKLSGIRIELARPDIHVPAALFAVRCYGAENEKQLP